MRLLTHLLVIILLGGAVVLAQDDFDEEEDAVITEDEEIEPAEEPKFAKPKYTKPVANGNTFFTDPFDSEADFKKSWILSEAKKTDTDEAISKYDGKWSVEEPADNPIEDDLGLVLKSRAKHHAVSAKLHQPFQFIGKPFVMQYEVRFQNGQECGGAYVKLLTDDSLNLKKFTDKTGYTIMFGPDRCGKDNKLHFIFRHKNPVNGEFEEKHAKKPTGDLDSYFSDKMTHLYTLVVRPNNLFEIYVDQSLVNSGSLLTDMSPPVNPEKEIVDPEDHKPEDWDEREKIPDPEATKPDEWDETEPEMIVDENAVKPEGWLDEEPELVPDPDAEMPSDWDEDMDGEWEPPMIQNEVCESAPGCGEWEAPQVKNPKYKGKWRAPMIDNPSYKGKWKPAKIPNPNYFEDMEPYKMTAIGAVGLELWSMSDGIMFDNFIITDDKAVADEWAADTWQLKRKHEMAGSSSGRSVVDAVMDATNERPWLWAVFLVVIILPIVLVIAYCCMPSQPKPASAPLHPKKTDKPTPDDKPADDSDATENSDNDSGGDDEKSAGDTKKTEEKKPAEGASKSTGDSKASKAKKSDLDAEEVENEADNEDDDSKQATRSSPRKRKPKPRKD